MDENRKAELQDQARARLATQRRRVRLLRQRCIAGSVICFALLWGIVFTQLVSGNDPVLGDSSPAVASTGSSARAEQAEIEANEAEALELEASEVEALELEAAELETAEAEAEEEALTTSPS